MRLRLSLAKKSVPAQCFESGGVFKLSKKILSGSYGAKRPGASPIRASKISRNTPKAPIGDDRINLQKDPAHERQKLIRRFSFSADFSGVFDPTMSVSLGALSVYSYRILGSMNA